MSKFNKYKKEIKFVSKSFDDLYSQSKNIARKWNTNRTVPVIVIGEVAEILIGNCNKMDLPELSSFPKEYTKMMNEIVSRCRKAAKKMDSKSVPLTLLKEYIDIFKKAYSDSLNGKK